MKKIIPPISLLVLIANTVLVCSCNDSKITRDTKKQIPLNSYSDLLNAKKQLEFSRPYDIHLFDTLLSATYSKYNYQVIDYSEAFSVYDGIFKEGAYHVWHSLDSTMKTTKYNGLSYWMNLSKTIASRTAEYQKLFEALESPNPNLQRADSMITNYEKVLSLSKSTFGKTPNRIVPYDISYTLTEDKIKNNPFWQVYFRHNTELNQNISEFPNRLKSARYNYYNELKDLIIKRAGEDVPTASQLSYAVRRFNDMTTNDNQAARTELNEFFESYVEPEDQEPSNNSFWQ